jgi:hypothetical protein
LGLWILVAELVALGLATGCGSGSRDEEAQKPIAEQCRDFVASYCGRASECAQSTDREDYADVCDFSFDVYLPCDQVQVVNRNTQACLDGIEAIRCSSVRAGTFPTQPEPCQGLFWAP